MSYTYVADAARRIVTVTVNGPLTMEAVLAAIDRQAAEGHWACGVLNDLREATGAVDSAGIRMLIGHVTRLTALHGTRGAVAIVSLEDAQFGMGRMYGSLGESALSFPIGVFRDIGAAERWLAERVPRPPDPV